MCEKEDDEILSVKEQLETLKQNREEMRDELLNDNE